MPRRGMVQLGMVQLGMQHPEVAWCVARETFFHLWSRREKQNEERAVECIDPDQCQSSDHGCRRQTGVQTRGRTLGEIAALQRFGRRKYHVGDKKQK